MTEREQSTTPSEPADSLDTEIPMTQHTDPTADPTTEPTAESTGSAPADPTAPATPDPTAPATPDPVPPLTLDPVAGDQTTAIETQHTQAVPGQTPFRVEPATPVPDDVTSEPAGATGDAAAPLSQLPPPAPQPWNQGTAPHPAYSRVTVRKGPRAGAVVFGLLAMLVSAYVIVVNVSDANLEFRIVGPALIGALGGLLLLVGLAGVLIGRLRR